MQIKIRITTPKGHAKKTEHQIRPFIIGRKGKLNKVLTNKEDNKILWIVDAKPRQYKRIIKNVSTYKILIQKVMSSKTVQKVAKLTDEQKDQLNKMLYDQTEIDIVKEKDWEKIKKEFN